MIDVDKLVAYLKSPFRFRTTAVPPMPEGLDQGDHDELAEALADDSSEESQTKRKLDSYVSYMEISENAGGFSCGNCKWFTPSGICINRAVRAQVSADRGCCNLFRPSSAKITFPPQEALPGDDGSVAVGIG